MGEPGLGELEDARLQTPWGTRHGGQQGRNTCRPGEGGRTDLVLAGERRWREERVGSRAYEHKGGVVLLPVVTELGTKGESGMNLRVPRARGGGHIAPSRRTRHG